MQILAFSEFKVTVQSKIETLSTEYLYIIKYQTFVSFQTHETSKIRVLRAFLSANHRKLVTTHMGRYLNFFLEIMI